MTKPWHRRARHAVGHSLKVRLVLVFLLLAGAMAFTFISGVQKALSVGWRDGARPMLMDYVDRLAADITVDKGGPPSIERAKAITQRLPVTVSLEPLDEKALIAVLTQPKNALVKQFQRLFALDNVELVFTTDALQTAASAALKHKTGARGLRSIIEETLLDVMYEVPSRPEAAKCIVNADTISRRTRPLLLNQTGQAIRWGSDADPDHLESAA